MKKKFECTMCPHRKCISILEDDLCSPPQSCVNKYVPLIPDWHEVKEEPTNCSQLPDWCKVGEWVYNTVYKEYVQISDIDEFEVSLKDGAYCTCGECKHYDFVGQCNYVYEFNNIHVTDKACSFFEQKNIITNGDKIRQMSDEELATAWSNDAFVFAWCADCPRYCREYESEETKHKCKQQMLNWLKQEAKDE